MQAALTDRYGPPDVVRVREVERPVPTGDQVLVRVRAASVNRADLDGLYPRWGFLRLILGVRRPRNPRLGSDVAGVVEAVGEGVTTFRPGDAVVGDLYGPQGAFAEFAVGRERVFAPLPPGMTFEDAATLPHSAVLALQGLRRRDRRTVKPGDRVLIVGASGNVGPFAVQIARSMGAHVTGVARTEKLDFVRSLGADEVIDYTAVDPRRTGQPYDWILDVDAHQTFLGWRRALRPNGVYITLGGSVRTLFVTGLLGPLVSTVGARWLGNRWLGMLLWWKPFDRDDVATLLELLAAGKLRPVIDRRFPLAQVADALRWVDDGKARGKVVITV